MNSRKGIMLALTLFPASALASDGLDSGDTAWMLTATALVLFMTLPGLALFYSGLVRNRNVLSVMMQCFAIACAASIVWVIAGYSLVFGDGHFLGGLTGGLGKAFHLKSAKTGKIGDGKIFVTQLDQVWRIRTGETGESAL